MAINVRTKGKAAELEWVNRFDAFFPDQLKRNLLQTREGGADVSGCYPFQVEIKRCEKLEFNKWWRQVLAACADPSEIPIVSYRQSKKAWRFLLPVGLMGLDGDGFVEASEEVFLQLVIKTYG